MSADDPRHEEPPDRSAHGNVTASQSRFDRDTAVEPRGDGRYAARIDKGWWIRRGPNGGYVTAVMLNAIRDATGDASRAPRSLTVHFTAPPAEGACEIAVAVERSGGSASVVTARLAQAGRLRAVAICALSRPRDAPSFCDLAMPEVPGPETIPVEAGRGSAPLGMHARYERRHAIGPTAFEGTDRPVVAGGWIRLVEPRAIDSLLIAALADAWHPAILGRFRPGEDHRGVPTLDLTVHFRTTVESLALSPDTWLLVRFATSCIAEGFLEEDGQIWTPDGILLAQSRQLAVLF